MEEESILIKRAQNGDMSAFRELVEKYNRKKISKCTMYDFKFTIIYNSSFVNCTS